VSELHDHASHAESDGLWRWLVGGLFAGAVVLGLLVGAYAIGYQRGEDHAGASTGASTAPPATTSTTTGAATGSVGPVTVTPALVARGKTLYTADGCVACHSLSGSAGAGPALDGIAGGTVTLADGSTVTRDDDYLARSITAADDEIVKGYRAGVMSAAVPSDRFDGKPDDLRALVAFIKAQK
jgi:mono/diheme cytochrome c family protein